MCDDDECIIQTHMAPPTDGCAKEVEKKMGFHWILKVFVSECIQFSDDCAAVCIALRVSAAACHLKRKPFCNVFVYHTNDTLLSFFSFFFSTCFHSFLSLPYSDRIGATVLHTLSRCFHSNWYFIRCYFCLNNMKADKNDKEWEMRILFIECVGGRMCTWRESTRCISIYYRMQSQRVCVSKKKRNYIWIL